MFKWIDKLLGAEVVLPPTQLVMPSIQPMAITDSASSDKVSIESLRDIFISAVKDAAAEKRKAEKDLLSSMHFQKYIKSTINYIATSINTESNSYFLVSALDVDVPPVIWITFMETFIKLSKEFGMDISIYNSYMRLEKSSAQKAINQLMSETLSIDYTELSEPSGSGKPYR